MRTYTIAGNTVTIQKNSLSYNDTLNDRTTCSFVVIDPAFEVDIGMEVIVQEDADIIFAGTIDSALESGDKTNYVSLACVDFSQLIDKRIIANSYENELAGDIVRDFITTVFAEEGITAGNVQDGPVISKAVFNYDSGNIGMNYLADTTGFNWEIDNLKRLNFFDRATFTAPFELTNTSHNYQGLTVKKSRSDYRNRQYIRAGTDTTGEIPLEKPTPAPDGVSKTFVVRLPIAQKPRIFINSVEVIASDIGVNGLDTGKKYYFTYGSNAITQDNSVATLTNQVLEVTYKGLYPLLVVADSPGQINSRKAIEGGSGVHENIIQEQNIDTRQAALEFAQGKLEKYGIIPKIVTFNTYEKGLKAGQLLQITNTKHNLSGKFLIDSVSARNDGVLTLYSVRCLDGASIGGWEQLFKTLLQGNKKLVIRENEVVVKLITFSDEFVNLAMEDEMTYYLHQYWICGQLENEFMLPWQPPSEITCSEERIL
ncbi:hypothetical protein [Desulfosporosinus sp.]|uniref:hypothetical protein n=1 Tax=Desulfosporosinus sp. TaxID=157907 RepID=UPI0025BB569C|nr:hypothetical protein [Desulfosporosinus sp.]MBC2721843.1 hypothetical protein [Desulfosporosinus sp.]MBC2726253.1 hypothetical protein [Desulfosporosinus sp.]